ncbi:NAD(P)-dependent oxidoreductase [Leifsonia sp. NPDC058230]|uniref:NAD(P)-dependent oxidoreductase n=1 Tax=Leifsonia sp. NPDC058230 TaxID=3346391 RepID=UPI0036DE8A9C
MSVNPDRTVALVGLGNLGRAIAARFLERGWQVSVLDRDLGRVEELTSRGARSVDAAGLADSRFVCFAVPDDAAVRDVLDGGLREALTSENTIVVHSTVLPERARQLAELVGDAAFLDVPVSGGAERAESGALTLFVGGDEREISDADPLLTELGDQRFVLGGVGTASAAKLAHQLILFSSLAGVHEALRLTAAYGVADDAVLEAVNTGLADTWAGRNWGFFDRLTAEYERAGVPRSERPYQKDLLEVVDAARSADIDVPLARLLSESLPGVVEQHAADWAKKEGALR